LDSLPEDIAFNVSTPIPILLSESEYKRVPLVKFAKVVLLSVEIAELLELIFEVLVEMLDVLDDISLSLDAMFVELALMLDSTSLMPPTARVPSTVASELKVVALATVPPVNEPPPPPTAVPSHSSVPPLLVKALLPI
jgi:hypothetical protein